MAVLRAFEEHSNESRKILEWILDNKDETDPKFQLAERLEVEWDLISSGNLKAPFPLKRPHLEFGNEYGESGFISRAVRSASTPAALTTTLALTRSVCPSR